MVSQDGIGVADQPRNDGEAADKAGSAEDLVEEPGKVMRVAAMVKQLLEEVRGAPLDDAGRTRLAEIHRRSIRELEAGLAPELVDELERITLPLGETPTDAELRIAQAQLVGWLEGLFHGIQAALFAQQMAAQQQLQTLRRALPPGQQGQDGGPGQQFGRAPGTPGHLDQDDNRPTGHYL